MKLLFVFGTRPEAIKLAPLIKFANQDEFFDVRVCTTGQHKEMLSQVLDVFDIEVDFSLEIMREEQTLSDISCDTLNGLKNVLEEWPCDFVVVHGDTTTTFAASLAAFYSRTEVVHVEAGLRTGNNYSPWPEELNRKLTADIAKMHFAPTEIAKANLIQENIDSKNIFVVGNTVVDAVSAIARSLEQNDRELEKYNEQFNFIDDGHKVILVTGHRRENIGDGISELCKALKCLAEVKNVQIVFPVHLNPRVKNAVHSALNGVGNIFLIEPVDYRAFIFLMKRSHHIITDSGGIQEEAVTFKKPVLITRQETERPEAVLEGANNLVGMNSELIVRTSKRLLADEDFYDTFLNAENPFGDGNSSSRILEIMKMVNS